MSTCGGSNVFELYEVYGARKQADEIYMIYGISIDPFQPSKSQDVVHLDLFSW